MMPTGVIQNDRHLSTLSAMPYKLSQKQLKGFGIERFLSSCDQTAVVRTNSTEYGDTFPCRRVENNRIDVFRRDPHNTA